MLRQYLVRHYPLCCLAWLGDRQDPQTSDRENKSGRDRDHNIFGTVNTSSKAFEFADPASRCAVIRLLFFAPRDLCLLRCLDDKPSRPRGSMRVSILILEYPVWRLCIITLGAILL